MNKQVNWIFGILVALQLAVASYHGYVEGRFEEAKVKRLDTIIDQQQDMISSARITTYYLDHIYKKQKDDDLTEIKADINSIHETMVNYNKHEYLILDSLVRIMHYTTPHKEKVIGCPICSQK